MVDPVNLAAVFWDMRLPHQERLEVARIMAIKNGRTAEHIAFLASRLDSLGEAKLTVLKGLNMADAAAVQTASDEHEVSVGVLSE